MQAQLHKYSDVILGSRLNPFKITALPCSTADAIGEALRFWAPQGIIRSVRPAPSGLPDLLTHTLHAQVYAVLHGGDRDLILQINTGDGASQTQVAMADLRLPCAED